MIKEKASILNQLKGLVPDFSPQMKAWNTLSEIGLPHKKSESYKFTPITSILEKNIDWNASAEIQFDQNLIYKEAGSHLVFINGSFSKDYSILHSDLKIEVKEVTEGKHDPYSLLNEALAPHELTIYSGTELPVFIYHFNGESISNPRIKVNVTNDDTLRVFEKVISYN